MKWKYIRLILLTLISIVAGLSLLIYPEKTNLWIIRGVGLVWALGGIGYILELYKLSLIND